MVYALICHTIQNTGVVLFICMYFIRLDHHNGYMSWPSNLQKLHMSNLSYSKNFLALTLLWCSRFFINFQILKTVLKNFANLYCVVVTFLYFSILLLNTCFFFSITFISIPSMICAKKFSIVKQAKSKPWICFIN